MLKIFKYIFILSSICLWSETKSDDYSYIVYSKEQIQEHKKNCIEKMQSNFSNIQDKTYQIQRAIRTILGDDADYIPKVFGAGEIFNDGVNSYQLMHNGVKIILNSYYDSQWLTDVIYGLKGLHEPQEEKCFHEILKYMPENATMIELGSYWAYYSLWFASQVKGAKNYLIEPDPIRLQIGIKNFEINNKTGFFRRGFVGKLEDKEPDINGTKWISMDDFIENEKIEHVNILHADIQGGESEMLESLVKNLDKIDYFFISTHGSYHHKTCLSFFNSRGFIIVASHADVESCSGDGLIVAKRKGVAGPDYIEIRKY